VVWKLGNLALDGIPDGLVVPMIVGIITSGVAGWIAVWGTLRLVRTHSFTPFVIYRVALGVVVLMLAATALR
jgi:undecaprenyl-diphosphatase